MKQKDTTVVQAFQPKTTFDLNATLRYLEITRDESDYVTEIAVFTMPGNPKFIRSRCIYNVGDSEPLQTAYLEFDTYQDAKGLD